MNKKLVALLLVTCAVSIALLLTPKKDYADCILIRAGRIFTGIDNKYVEKKELLIVAGKIVSILEYGTKVDNCRILDATRNVLLPGLIDGHTHLLLGSRNLSFSLEKIIHDALLMSAPSRVEIGLVNARSMIHSGFTTVRDLGNSGYFLDVELQKRLQQEPLKGPKLFVSGPGLAVLPTQAGKDTKEYRTVEKDADIGKAIEENLYHNLSWLKVYADNDPEKGQMPAELLKNVIQRAHEIGIKVAVHTTNSAGAIDSLRFGADSLEHFYEFPNEIISDSKPFIVLTDLSQKVCQDYGKFKDDTLYKNCKYLLDMRSERIQWALKNGYPLVFGSDSFMDSDGSRGESALEALISLQEEGLSPFQVLQSAGVTAARMLGQSDLGEISPGKIADIIAVSGDPLKSISDLKNTRLVIKDGRIVCQSEDSCRRF